MNSAIMQYGLMTRIKGLFRQSTKMPKIEALTPLKLYRSIHELPLTIFIDCLCDAEYNKLIINGQPTESEFTEVWQDLFQQYTELIGGKSVENRLKTLKQQNKLETKLTIIHNLLEVIQVLPSQEMFDMLYTFGYPLPKKEFTPDNFNSILKIFIGHFKLDRNRYKLAVVTKEPVKELQPVNRNEFTKVLARVALAFKTPPISITAITTAQYCNYVLEYQDYCDSLAKQDHT